MFLFIQNHAKNVHGNFIFLSKRVRERERERVKKKKKMLQRYVH